jgi:Xaa-Pro aminopeptidase
MFQSFDATSDPAQGPGRLAALRDVMAAAGVDGFLVPRADRYQGEYVAACDERLAWLTGFTGSAGFAAVLADVAGVFIDGRYRVQVRDQVADVFTPVHWPQTSLADWLIKQLPQGGVVAYDPWLHAVDEVAALTKDVAAAGISLRAVQNMVDQIWSERPARPSAPFFAQPLELTGEAHADKRARLTKEVSDGAFVITLPDSIAWLLNIRGADIARNPVPQAFAILAADGRVDLFASAAKVADLGDHLGPDVTVRNDFDAAVAALAGPVRIDPKSCPQAVRDLITTEVIEAQDPCILPKARKTEVEIAGSRAAHLRDGAAMVRFLAWLDAEAPKGQLTEIAVTQALEGFRRETNALRDISFETICGAGAHGAIVHYRVTRGTDAPVKSGELLLVDSGGQYVDGTTDITRTVIVGTPSASGCAGALSALDGGARFRSRHGPRRRQLSVCA